jgi:acyl dehydratase
MGDFAGYSLVAFNTGTASTNKIHDDEVAKRFGFRGGLVPGVDVYAYLTHPPAAAWGRDWLERGTMRARFVQPVYDGDEVEVVPVGDVALELRDSAGAVCANATASFPVSMPDAVDPEDWPAVDQRVDPPSASPEALMPGTALGLVPHTFRAERAAEYLADIRETLPLYEAEGIAHPGWLLRDANYVLSSNVRLGPWIHVESDVQHLGLVRDGDEVSARALVTAEWEAKGHRFVTLDVLHLAGARPVARTTHTAIYRPRGAA